VAVVAVSSSGTGLKRRVPQGDRGERRVAEVLEAAALVIGERGYDAATMTEIAERAGASIGALYQYFPNKVAIGQALRQHYAEEMRASWASLMVGGGLLSVEQLVDGMLDLMIEFMEDRPAFLPLLNAPLAFKRDPVARVHLRELFAALFREKRTDLTHDEAYRMANVTLQVVKGLRPLYAEAKGAERGAIVREFKVLLTAYLMMRLGQGMGNRA
jgi:AcrR family transcriptional regulator